jgi:hypothetical protein
VEQTVRKPALNGGANTNLLLSDGRGKTMGVYLKGEDPALVPGTKLEEVKISEKTKEGRVFLILESYNALQDAAKTV